MSNHGGRVVLVYGAKENGSGVLIDKEQILTAAHLGFTLNNIYKIARNGQEMDAKCTHICKALDFAVLSIPEIPMCALGGGSLVPGRSYNIIGYPHSTVQQDPTVLEIVLDGINSDGKHYNGIPRPSSDFCGAPVLSKLGSIGGIVVGAVDKISVETTLLTLTEQPGVLILPYTTIMAIFLPTKFAENSTPSLIEIQ
uniref:Peptidase S1 domain-containing protein n=1 Tax=Panagrolaimus superbus TaxID=310955 RepID=A0A914Y7S9_9BILA